MRTVIEPHVSHAGASPISCAFCWSSTEPPDCSMTISLTSVVDASRELMTGRLNARLLPEVLYLIVTSLIMIEFAMRALRRRMVS